MRKVVGTGKPPGLHGLCLCVLRVVGGVSRALLAACGGMPAVIGCRRPGEAMSSRCMASVAAAQAAAHRRGGCGPPAFRRIKSAAIGQGFAAADVRCFPSARAPVLFRRPG